MEKKNSAVRGGNIYLPYKILTDYISVSNSSICGKYFHANFEKIIYFQFKLSVCGNQFYIYKQNIGILFQFSCTLHLLTRLWKRLNFDISWNSEQKILFQKKDFDILFSCLNFFFCFEILHFYFTAVQLQIIFNVHCLV